MYWAPEEGENGPGRPRFPDIEASTLDAVGLLKQMAPSLTVRERNLLRTRIRQWGPGLGALRDALLRLPEIGGGRH